MAQKGAQHTRPRVSLPSSRRELEGKPGGGRDVMASGEDHRSGWPLRACHHARKPASEAVGELGAGSTHPALSGADGAELGTFP